jgi:hypothetical protein
MEKQRSTVIFLVMALAGCTTRPSSVPTHIDQRPTITIKAGESVLLKNGQQALVPSGATLSSGKSEFKINGNGLTMKGRFPEIVSVPIDAKGPADNLIIVAPPLNGPADASGQRDWLPGSPAFQPNWRKIDPSFYINLGDDSEAIARLANLYYTEDIPETLSSKSLICKSGYKKFLVRSLYIKQSAISVFETQDGLVIGTMSLASPPTSAGAIALCIDEPPKHVEGRFTQLWLPL